MSILRRSIPVLLLGLLACLFLWLSPAAWADGSTVEELQAAVDRGDNSFILTGDLTVPKGAMVGAQSTAVVVPKGKTLIMNGGILELSTLRLVGGKIEVRNGSIFRVNEKFDYSSGTVEIYNGYNLFPAADILPDNTGVITYPNGSGITNLLFTPKSESEFASAVASINNLADNFDAVIFVHTDLTLTGMHILTHRTFINVLATLTLSDSAFLQYDRCGGSVSLQNPNPGGKGGSILNNGILLIGSANLAPGCLLRSTGVTETDELSLGNAQNPGGEVEIDGGVFRVNSRFHYNGAGTVKVYSGYNLFPAADILPDNTGVITYPNGSGTTSLLFMPTNDSEFASAVSAINGMADNFVGNITIRKNLALTGKHVLTHQTFLNVDAGLTLEEGALLQYDRCGGSVSLQNPNPDGKGGAISNNGALLVNNIELMPGCLLRSAGITETNELRFGNEENVGGEVEIDGGVFRVNNRLISSGGSITISRKCFNLFPAADVLALADYTDVFHYEDEGIQTSLFFRPSNNSQAKAALETANGLDDRFVADINIDFGWRVTGSAVLSHKAELRINGGRGGSLTVANGASFTKDGGGNIFLSNNGSADCKQVVKVSGKMAVGNLTIDPGCALLLEDTGILTAGKLQIDGRFAHNGTLVLRQKLAADPEPRLIMNGDYACGDGRIYVLDFENLDSYFANFDTDIFEKSALDKGTLYAPFTVDMVLPAKLRGIEEEAFAENGFITVFIPEKVQFIDDSAFADIDGLCVIGYSGTEAQRFANDNGFAFIAVS